MRLLLCSVVLFAGLTSTGCGAAISSYLILSAQSEVDGAEAAEAEKYAPYHYTAAKEYLHKAREEQGYAEFQPAIEFAYRAKEHAELGRAKAEQMKRDNVPPPTPPAPPEAETGGPTGADAASDEDEAPRKAKPNIIIKKKAPAPAATQDAPAAPPTGTTAPPSAAAPKAPEDAPAPTPEAKGNAKSSDASGDQKSGDESDEASGDDASGDDASGDDDDDAEGAPQKPRGPIIIPILPTTGSGDS